jgi:hypothetical protein
MEAEAIKRSKFNQEQITYALRKHEAGTPVEDVCRADQRRSRVEIIGWPVSVSF